jgi:hypothetical protein
MKTELVICIGEMKPLWAKQQGLDIKAKALGMSDVVVTGSYDLKITRIYGTVQDEKAFRDAFNSSELAKMAYVAQVATSKKLSIFIEDCKEHEDSGAWRSYDLETEGETLDECLDNAVYWQVNQDGESLGGIPADDDLAIRLITEKWNQK